MIIPIPRIGKIVIYLKRNPPENVAVLSCAQCGEKIEYDPRVTNSYELVYKLNHTSPYCDTNNICSYLCRKCNRMVHFYSKTISSEDARKRHVCGDEREERILH